MQLPLQVTFHGLSSSDALESAIQRRAGRLERAHPRMMSCRVAVELDGAPEFRVRIDVKVPGEEIVVNGQHDHDVYVALRDAFDAARRRLAEQRAALKARRHIPPVLEL